MISHSKGPKKEGFIFTKFQRKRTDTKISSRRQIKEPGEKLIWVVSWEELLKELKPVKQNLSMKEKNIKSLRDIGISKFI